MVLVEPNGLISFKTLNPRTQGMLQMVMRIALNQTAFFRLQPLAQLGFGEAAEHFRSRFVQRGDFDYGHNFFGGKDTHLSRKVGVFCRILFAVELLSGTVLPAPF